MLQQISVLFINVGSCLTWYRGNYIQGDYSNSKTFGAYYSNAINKIILTQDSSNVNLFDPYSCTFESIYARLPSFTTRDVTSVNDTIYIDRTADSKYDHMLSFDPFTFSVSDMNFKPTTDSCLMADETRKNLYNVGGGDVTYQDECTYDENMCFFGESYTRVYSIENKVSFYDSSMNEKRRHPACLAYKNQLYVFGGDIKIVYYKAGIGNEGPYYNETLSVEIWNLNITNTQSVNYGWKYMSNITLTSAYPSPIIFNNKIYLFNFHIDVKDNHSTIQIFDPIERTITDDLSSESFYIKTKHMWNIKSSDEWQMRDNELDLNDPINVNDELIYIFGSQSGPAGKNTFSFAVSNDSVLDKLSPLCFWIPTLSPTLMPTAMPSISTSNTPKPTLKIASPTITHERERLIIILIVIALVFLLGIIVCYVVFQCRKQKHNAENKNAAPVDEIDQHNEGLDMNEGGEGEGEILNDINIQVEGKQTEMVSLNP